MLRHLVVSVAALVSVAPLASAQRTDGPGERQRLVPVPSPTEYADRMLRDNDANGDGKIAKDEMSGRFSDRLFEMGDTNQDGFLERPELEKVAEGFAERRRNAGEGVAPGQERPQPGAERAAAFGQSGFEGSMRLAGRSLRQLRRSALDNDSRERDLELIQAIQSALVAAKGATAEVEMAPQAKETYGDDTGKFRTDLRLRLNQAVFEALAFEAAILEGDSAAAKESLEELIKVQQEGHDAFQPEEDEEEEEEAGEVPPPSRGRPADPTIAPGRGG
jgi:hypothetical protein